MSETLTPLVDQYQSALRDLSAAIDARWAAKRALNEALAALEAARLRTNTIAEKLLCAAGSDAGREVAAMGELSWFPRTSDGCADG